MTVRLDEAGRQALALYDGAPLGDRVHVRLRWWSCPLPAVEGHVPRDGRILDLGCGHGLFSAYLAIAGPDRTVLGVDIDERKLEVASRAARSLDDDRLSFAAAGAEARSDPWDAVVLVDVLYLLDPGDRRDLLRRAAAMVGPGGVVIVKETATSPWWKYQLTRAQEVLATRVLRITEGHELRLGDPADDIAVLRGDGLRVTATRLDRGAVHPHHLIVARRPR